MTTDYIKRRLEKRLHKYITTISESDRKHATLTYKYNKLCLDLTDQTILYYKGYRSDLQTLSRTIPFKPSYIIMLKYKVRVLKRILREKKDWLTVTRRHLNATRVKYNTYVEFNRKLEPYPYI